MGRLQVALIVATLLCSLLAGFGYLGSPGSWLLVASAFACLLGVQVPTLALNIPPEQSIAFAECRIPLGVAAIDSSGV